MATPNARGSMENKSSIGAADMLPVSSQVAYPKDKYAGMSPSAIRELLLVKPRPKPINTEKPGITNSITTMVQKPYRYMLKGPDIETIPAMQLSGRNKLAYKDGSDKPYSGYVTEKGYTTKGAKRYYKRYYQDGIPTSTQAYGMDDDMPIGDEVDLRPKKRKGLMSKFIDVINPADDSYSE